MPERSIIPNVLADRYASTRMLGVWSPEAKVVAGRDLWIAVMSAQADLGVDIPRSAIEDYRRVKGEVDLDRIRTREFTLRHDIKALLEEFNELAGHEHAHKAMTARDLTENVEQMQGRDASRVILPKVASGLFHLMARGVEYTNLVMAGRSHNVPGQMTTLGKRFATAAEELLRAHDRICSTLNSYPLRGIKGPMGTQQDMLDLLGGKEKVIELERRVAAHLGFESTLDSCGQVYPRSLDFEVISNLVQAAQALSSFATTVRLMAGHELVTEGFKEGQVGSTAMPHKMNARSCERVRGFYNVLRGHLTMIEGVAGDQWNEGDVSCSVVRRVAVPDSFFTMDGLLETFLTILNEFGAYPAVISAEVLRYLPFLATTKVLMAAIKAGMGREEAHACIKTHSTAALRGLRAGTSGADVFFRGLGSDPQFLLSADDIQAAVGSPTDFVGLAQEQVAAMERRVEACCAGYPDAAAYIPEPIL